MVIFHQLDYRLIKGWRLWFANENENEWAVIKRNKSIYVENPWKGTNHEWRWWRKMFTMKRVENRLHRLYSLFSLNFYPYCTILAVSFTVEDWGYLWFVTLDKWLSCGTLLWFSFIRSSCLSRSLSYLVFILWVNIVDIAHDLVSNSFWRRYGCFLLGVSSLTLISRRDR